jgi:hypothetical protein
VKIVADDAVQITSLELRDEVASLAREPTQVGARLIIEAARERSDEDGEAELVGEAAAHSELRAQLGFVVDHKEMRPAARREFQCVFVPRSALVYDHN